MTESEIQHLQELMAACVDVAVAEGYDGTAEDFDYTRYDMEFVVDGFGRKPTREEWIEALGDRRGLAVGSAYVKGEED